MKVLISERKTGLSKGKKLFLRSGVVVESLCSLKLDQALAAVNEICKKRHKVNCERCLVLLKACDKLMREQVCSLGELWRYATSGRKYESFSAKRTLLQLPIAILGSGTGRSGFDQLMVTAKKDEGTYNILLEKFGKQGPKNEKNFKELLKDLMLLSESEAERERLKYTATVLTSSSRRGASTMLGISMSRKNNREKKIKKACIEIRRLRRKLAVLMNIEIQAKFGNMGWVKLFKDEEGTDDEGESDENSDVETEGSGDEQDFKDVAEDQNDSAITYKEIDDQCVLSEESDVDGSDDDEEDTLTEISLGCSIERTKSKYRNRYKSKVSKLYVRRKATKNVNDIVSKYPDIGEVMEQYARDCDVGADQWRRTGLYTFGSEKRTEKRLTFERMKNHLESHYHRNFSIGTVVQLCAKRHRRHRSSLRYKQVANIRYLRAWKGWNIKLNPDAHWSRSMYRLLDVLQKNTEDSVIVGRDDQAGFRLDTTFTHKQHPSLCVTNTITTHTDFVNKTTTNLQITSYNFPAAANYPETCVGVVKASHLHQKSPSQHMADLTMLERTNEHSHLFKNKLVEYVRVDGASDEGPSHIEVQFLWTERHFTKGTLVTMVTTRCSGDSRLNRVELQNSHLSKGHSNTFIPSTLAGSHTNEDGEFNLVLIEMLTKGTVSHWDINT